MGDNTKSNLQLDKGLLLTLIQPNVITSFSDNPGAYYAVGKSGLTQAVAEREKELWAVTLTKQTKLNKL
jgi:hypothetical protein